MTTFLLLQIRHGDVDDVDLSGEERFHFTPEDVSRRPEIEQYCLDLKRLNLQLSRFFLSILTTHVKKTVPELEIALQKVHELRGENVLRDSLLLLAQKQISLSLPNAPVFVQWTLLKVPTLWAPKKRWSTSCSWSTWTICTNTLWERTTLIWCSWWRRNPRRYDTAEEEGETAHFILEIHIIMLCCVIQGCILSSTCRFMHRNTRVPNYFELASNLEILKQIELLLGRILSDWTLKVSYFSYFQIFILHSTL